MKQLFLVIVCFHLFEIACSQGITLLYKGGGTGGWNDPGSWVQIKMPAGQQPIQRVPTELDDVIFSKTLSGLASVGFIATADAQDFTIGGNATAGNRCRSMHVSGTQLSFDQNFTVDIAAVVNIYTSTGGFVLADSGSNLYHGLYELHGGNAALTDLQITDSKFGNLFSHATWSEIVLDSTAKARFINSAIEGWHMGPREAFYNAGNGGMLFASNCTFSMPVFNLGDNSVDTLLNCDIKDIGYVIGLYFHIGKNARLVSSNVNVIAFNYLEFYTSGSVLNGNVSVPVAGSYFDFGQEDPTHPLPNIINGNFYISETNSVGIKGDLKISGNFTFGSVVDAIYPDTTHAMVNGQPIFFMGGIKNFGATPYAANCPQNYCRFKLEFFGSTNSNVLWPVGFPIDTLIVNKTNCAKVTFTNSLYVAAAAIIQGGQLVLNPNPSIAYKFVCAGDLTLQNGGGLFLRKDSNGIVASMAVSGKVYDYNTVVDSSCAGLSNPYNGSIALYRQAANDAPQLITLTSNSNIGNLSLLGQTGSDFLLGGSLAVNNISFSNPGKLLLGNYNLIVNGAISNFGPSNYFVTNGTGKLQINGVGSTERIFPVGTSTSSYTPARISNSGTVDNFSVSVQPKVFSGGTTGTTYAGGVVNKTWNITEVISGGSNAIVTLQWNTADELVGFTRNTSALGHYVSGAWNTSAPTSAAGSNPYTLSRNAITSFSPFAVFGSTPVLPVTLLDFSGQYSNQSVVLNWSTAMELNTQSYTIEKGFEPGMFSTLTTITATGNATGKQTYRYTDNGILKAINYYRLKMIDVDGSFNYSKTIAVKAVPDNALAIFPNPVKNKLFIRFNMAAATTASIADSRGTIVKTIQLKAGASEAAISVGDLPAGLYSISLHSARQNSTQTFIKK